MVSGILIGRAAFVMLAFCFPIISQVVPSRPPRVTDANRQDAASKAWYDEIKKRENAPTGIGSVRDTNETLFARLKDDARKKLAPLMKKSVRIRNFSHNPEPG